VLPLRMGASLLPYHSPPNRNNRSFLATLAISLS